MHKRDCRDSRVNQLPRRKRQLTLPPEDVRAYRLSLDRGANSCRLGEALIMFRKAFLSALFGLVLPLTSAHAGVGIGIGIGLPYYAPAPYYRPYYAPYYDPPVYAAPPVYTVPAPVYVQPGQAPVYGSCLPSSQLAFFVR
jgi:hypothetical protein